MSKKVYEVLEKDGVQGLTVGSHVIKPGGTFTREAWPYSEEKLKVATDKRRCKLISSGETKKPEKVEK